MNDRIELARHILDGLTMQGVQHSECNVTDTVKTEVYYESGKISMIRTNFNTSLSMKAVSDFRKGVVVTNSTDINDIDNCIKQTIEAMGSALPDEAEGISECAEKAEHIRGASAADMNAMFNGMEEFLAQVKREYPLVSFDTITVEYDSVNRLYVNTNGAELRENNGFYVFSPMFMAVRDGKSSSFCASYALFDDISKSLISLADTKNTLAEAEKQIDTESVEGKFVGDIIFTPSCMETVLGVVESSFLSDPSLIMGTSLYKDSLGKKVAADSVTVRSEPRNETLPGGSFMTGDGYICEDMDIIKDGVLQNFVLSRYGAKKSGQKRATTSGGNYVMSAGNTPAAQLIGSVKNGLLVNRFSGGRPGANGEFSGIAKNSFLIKDGKVAQAVSETMISGNMAQVLKDVADISAERINTGDCILPWVKVSGITISGK